MVWAEKGVVESGSGGVFKGKRKKVEWSGTLLKQLIQQAFGKELNQKELDQIVKIKIELKGRVASTIAFGANPYEDTPDAETYIVLTNNKKIFVRNMIHDMSHNDLADLRHFRNLISFELDMGTDVAWTEDGGYCRKDNYPRMIHVPDISCIAEMKNLRRLCLSGISFHDWTPYKDIPSQCLVVINNKKRPSSGI